MKILMVRLSSLGDVVLASAALEALQSRGGAKQSPQNGFDRERTQALSKYGKAQVDWVTSSQLGDLLDGHPGLTRVWRFQRHSGLSGWFQLCRELYDEDYDQVIDLHRSLRSFLLRCFFYVWSAFDLKAPPRFFLMPKARWRSWGYFVFKRLWPRVLRPKPVTERSARTAGGKGLEKPDLSFLRERLPADFTLHEGGRYFCIMPGSLWEGKRFPVSTFVDVCLRLSKSGFLPVVMGTLQDRESLDLVAALGKGSIPHFSGVGRWSLPQVAAIMARAEFYLGNDTGLAHLAESVGTPAHVLFGPTVPDLGFGPWREKSRSYGASLLCRPCGKDGRYCYRVFDRYRCLRSVDSSQILSEIG